MMTFLDDDLEEAAPVRRWDRIAKSLVTLTILVIAAVLLLLWPRIFIPIRSGEAGVLYRLFSGTEVSALYGEGLHIIYPWNRMHIYNTRLQIRENAYQLLTSDGLPVTVYVAIRYRADVRLLPTLHVNVGKNYAEKVVLPETEAVLRRAVGRYTAEEVYTSRRGFLETVIANSLVEGEERYVIIDAVLVRRVELPGVVRDAIENKMALQEQSKAYAYRIDIEIQEARRKKIEAEGIKDYQDTISKSLSPDLLRWQGIRATTDLATSENAKTVVIGSGEDGLPIILGGDR
ncbi:prohibitin family protein [Labrenzia sp. PHM005]|uniref:prohibitin family protein n=1 Tax=Labrenzia sp. PHM005 TaxID=2590016 RepID=UPI0011407894|nr:prohibitin family protein [Labrenzia sp. PHM005]QDG75019.1 prohibitin family protein [Labrenzia sp. PHM005]